MASLMKAVPAMYQVQFDDLCSLDHAIREYAADFVRRNNYSSNVSVLIIETCVTDSKISSLRDEAFWFFPALFCFH
jgi:hypothetical protein